MWHKKNDIAKTRERQLFTPEHFNTSLTETLQQCGKQFILLQTNAHNPVKRNLHIKLLTLRILYLSLALRTRYQIFEKP